MPEIRLLVVDLDGTLVDSAPDLSHCVDQALESVGLAPPGARTRAWIGDGIEALLRRAMSHAGASPEGSSFAAVLETFSACYRDNLFVRSRLYPDVPATLAYLEDRGVRLACVTNKRAAFADAVLVAAGIRERFLVLYGADSLPEKKPSPLPLLAAARECRVAPAQAAMVGDSHHDYAAAAAAGFTFFWASYGYCPRIEARPAAAVTEIRGFADLRGLVDDTHA